MRLYRIPHTNTKGQIVSWDEAARGGGVVYLPPRTSSETKPRLVLGPPSYGFEFPAIAALNTKKVRLWDTLPALDLVGTKMEWRVNSDEVSYPTGGTLTQSESNAISYSGEYAEENPESANTWAIQRVLNATYYPFFGSPKVPTTLEGLDIEANAPTKDTVSDAEIGATVIFGSSLRISTDIVPMAGEDSMLQPVAKGKGSSSTFALSAGLVAFPNLAPGTRVIAWGVASERNIDDPHLYAMQGYPTLSAPDFGAAEVAYQIKAYPVEGSLADFTSATLGTAQEVEVDSGSAWLRKIPLGDSTITHEGWVYLTVPESRMLCLAVELPVTDSEGQGILNKINIATAFADDVQPGYRLVWSREVSVSLTLRLAGILPPK